MIVTILASSTYLSLTCHLWGERHFHDIIIFLAIMLLSMLLQCIILLMLFIYFFILVAVEFTRIVIASFMALIYYWNAAQNSLSFWPCCLLPSVRLIFVFVSCTTLRYIVSNAYILSVTKEKIQNKMLTVKAFHLQHYFSFARES